MVPLVGIGVVAAPSFRRSRAIVAESQEIDQRVIRLNALLELRYALTTELVPTEGLIRANEFGVNAEQASELLGFDVTSRLTASRITVDRILFDPAVRPMQFIDEIERSVVAARASVDDGTAVIDKVHQTYSEAIDALTEASSAELDETISASATSAGQVQGVEAAAFRLVGTFEFVRTGSDEVEALFQLTVLTTDADRRQLRDQLVALRSMYQRQLESMRRIDSPAISSMLASIESNPDVIAFDRSVDAELARDVTTPLDVSMLASIFRAGFTRFDLFRELLQIATGEATGLAHQRQKEATTAQRNEAITIAVLALVISLCAIAIAWSLSRRMRQLAIRAEQVSQGMLDGPRADEGGPREIAVVAQALNDTVDNLQQIQAQATALANGNLDDPSLATPGAGMLGASVHATVERLSQAWREREQLQERLAYQADHDLLTGLPNRKFALEALGIALANARANGGTTAVLFLDLDGFKQANDAHGHHMGDLVLRACADRLTENARPHDFVARLGGDEFLVIAEGVSHVDEAVNMASRLIAAVSLPIDLQATTTRVGASVGIGINSGGDVSSSELLRDADNAVHRAKRRGKGQVEVFDELARAEQAMQADLEKALAAAVEHGDLRLHYQPVTNTVNGQLQGFEALARWRRNGQDIPPDVFIPVAERSELVNDIGRWALGEATAQLARWTAAGVFVGAYMAVNISGRHLLSDDLISDVRGALRASGLDPGRLIVEITETMILSDTISAVAHLESLRSIGVRVALDDFGTGYTSIGQLWRLPVDILKIDGSFISGLDAKTDQAIVGMMIEVAHTLGLTLVAECVETGSQHEALRELQCDSVQGYLIARPQPPEELLANTLASQPLAGRSWTAN